MVAKDEYFNGVRAVLTFESVNELPYAMPGSNVIAQFIKANEQELAEELFISIRNRVVWGLFTFEPVCVLACSCQ